MEKQLQIVNFEQAKKLEQLGFNYETNEYWVYRFKEHITAKETYLVTKENALLCDKHAPSIALALKWLRDEKNITINVVRMLDNFEPKYKCFIDTNLSKYEHNGRYSSWEQAELAGLDYALYYLLKEKQK